MSITSMSKVESAGGGIEESMVIGEEERAAVLYFQPKYSSVRMGNSGCQFACVRVTRCRHVLLSRYWREEYLGAVNGGTGKKETTYFPPNKPCMSSMNP